MHSAGGGRGGDSHGFKGEQGGGLGDGEALRRVVQKLWQLAPGDPEQRRLGYDSGVR